MDNYEHAWSQFMDDDDAFSFAPPQSHSNSPQPDDTVSTIFHPQAQLQTIAPDIVLVSSDAVLFYVHSRILLDASHNGFGSLLPTPIFQNDRVLPISESSALLNIVLCSIYNSPVADFSSTFSTLIAAVNKLPVYGISIESCIPPSSSLFSLLLSYATQCPLELYAFSARHNLNDLAVSASMYLLSFNIASLSDDMANIIGPIYLKRLFFLYFGRLAALKRVLIQPPNPHPPTLWCNFAEQKNLTRAWALASAYLAWDAQPDMSTSSMESVLQPLARHLSCDKCRDALCQRINLLTNQWSAIKRTI